VKTVVLRTNLV